VVSCVLWACGEQAGPAGPAGPGITISVAPLTLPGLSRACYDIAVVNALGETVVSRGDPTVSDPASALCSDRFGNGAGGDISYVAPCDADQPNHTVYLWIDSLFTVTGATETSLDDWRNPCPPPANGALNGCSLPVTCAENADVPVTFTLVIMRDANQGFFDIAVNLDDIFCSAKVDCTQDVAGTEPLNLLFDANGDRAPTIVMAAACTAGPSHDTASVLHMSNVVVDCGAAGTFDLDPTVMGNAWSPVHGGDPVWQYAVYRGQEALSCGGISCQKLYWNVAIGLDTATAGCTLRAAVTTARAPGLVEGATPAATTYPYINIEVPLTLPGGGRACTQNPLNGPTSGVQTRYTSSSVTREFCYRFDGITAAIQPACTLSAGIAPMDAVRGDHRVSSLTETVLDTTKCPGARIWWVKPAPGPMNNNTTYAADAGTTRDKAISGLRSLLNRASASAELLKKGDVVYLTRGTYFGEIDRTSTTSEAGQGLFAVGTSDCPIVVRSAPGDLAIIDGGLREAQENPATAWEDWTKFAGVPGEYRTTSDIRKVPLAMTGGIDPIGGLILGNPTAPDGGLTMGGHIPLFGYKHRSDLRATNEYWVGLADDDIATASSYQCARKGGCFVWAGPGTRWMPTSWNTEREACPSNIPAGVTNDQLSCGIGSENSQPLGRIHIRLQPTSFSDGPSNDPQVARYTGATDPRTIPLDIPVFSIAFQVKEGSQHLRLEDLVIRGGRRIGLRLDGFFGNRNIGNNVIVFVDKPITNVTIKNVTIYSGQSGLSMGHSRDVRVEGSRIFGNSAMWHSRAHIKYRSDPGYLVDATGTSDRLVMDRNFIGEGHDGLYLEDPDTFTFTRNEIRRLQDDGIITQRKYIGVRKIAQNLVTGCVQCLSTHNTGLAVPLAAGVKIEFAPPPAAPAGLAGVFFEPASGVLGSPNYKPDSGTYVYRNQFDLRRGVYSRPPTTSEASAAQRAAVFRRVSGVVGDHGTVKWPIFFVYHNTFVFREPTSRYGHGFASGLTEGYLRLVNNLFLSRINNWKPALLPDKDLSSTGQLMRDLDGGNNLFWNESPVPVCWSIASPLSPTTPLPPASADGICDAGEARPGYSDPVTGIIPTAVKVCGFDMSGYGTCNATGLLQGDRVLDPGLIPRWDEPLLPSLIGPSRTSPMTDVGRALPAGWPDAPPWADTGAPDIGAFPAR